MYTEYNGKINYRDEDWNHIQIACALKVEYIIDHSLSLGYDYLTALRLAEAWIEDFAREYHALNPEVYGDE